MTRMRLEIEMFALTQDEVANLQYRLAKPMEHGRREYEIEMLFSALGDLFGGLSLVAHHAPQATVELVSDFSLPEERDLRIAELVLRRDRIDTELEQLRREEENDEECFRLREGDDDAITPSS